jgi:uncharacterized protein YbjT (DUF2867 family)
MKALQSRKDMRTQDPHGISPDRKSRHMDRRYFLGSMALSAGASSLLAGLGVSPLAKSAQSQSTGARNMIVITAPTGRIGEQVLKKVLHANVRVRVIARDPSRLPATVLDRIEVVQGSHGDAGVVNRAFEGADTVFWLCPADPRAESVEAAYLGFTRPACAAFRSRSVKRVVGISALGRGLPIAQNAGYVTASLAMDDMIASTGVSFRALTMPSFMDNILRQIPSLKARGVFFSPLSANRKLPTCATRDIAAVAAGLLLDSSWSGQESVPVLGPEDLSCNDMAQIMSEVLGKPVRCQHTSGEAFKAQLIQNGMSGAMAQGMLDMAIAKDNGLDNAEPRTARSTTPTTFRQWCAEELKPAMLS